MNEAVREMTFEEEYEILQRESEKVFAMEDPRSEPIIESALLRQALRCIDKLMKTSRREWYQKGYQDGLNADKWIPVEERLPESEDKYGWVKCNVTVMRSHYPTSSYDFCDSPYDEYFVAEAMYDVTQKIWHIGEMTHLNALIDIDDSPLNGDYVIAWQPLPQLYKKEGVTNAEP